MRDADPKPERSEMVTSPRCDRRPGLPSPKVASLGWATSTPAKQTPMRPRNGSRLNQAFKSGSSQNVNAMTSAITTTSDFTPPIDDSLKEILASPRGHHLPAADRVVAVPGRAQRRCQTAQPGSWSPARSASPLELDTKPADRCGKSLVPGGGMSGRHPTPAAGSRRRQGSTTK